MDLNQSIEKTRGNHSASLLKHISAAAPDASAGAYVKYYYIEILPTWKVLILAIGVLLLTGKATAVMQWGFAYRTELDSTHAVAQLVQRRRPAHDAHHVGHHQQNASCHSRLSRQAHLQPVPITCVLYTVNMIIFIIYSRQAHLQPVPITCVLYC